MKLQWLDDQLWNRHALAINEGAHPSSSSLRQTHLPITQERTERNGILSFCFFHSTRAAILPSTVGSSAWGFESRLWRKWSSFKFHPTYGPSGGRALMDILRGQLPQGRVHRQEVPQEGLQGRRRPGGWAAPSPLPRLLRTGKLTVSPFSLNGSSQFLTCLRIISTDDEFRWVLESW